MTVLITFATHSKDPGTDVYKGQMIWITGMCGGCRIEYDGKPMFVCVDGPEFDGHQVNFGLLTKRLAMYKGQELISLEEHKRTGQVTGEA